MAKPKPVDVTDSGHTPKRKFKCNGTNVFRLIGNDLDDNAKVELKDHKGVATWDTPKVNVVMHGLEFQLEAKCSCRRSGFTGLFAVLLAPILFLLELLGIITSGGSGGLTVTVTNGGGEVGDPLVYNTIDYV